MAPKSRQNHRKRNGKVDFLHALVPIHPSIPTLISGMNSAEGAGAELSQAL